MTYEVPSIGHDPGRHLPKLVVFSLSHYFVEYLYLLEIFFDQSFSYLGRVNLLA